MSTETDRHDVQFSSTALLPQGIACLMLATATLLAWIDYRQGQWEWVIWPRSIQAGILVLAASAIVLARVPSGSWFTTLFAAGVLGLGLYRSLHSLQYGLPSILWPNTLLAGVHVISGTAIMVLSSARWPQLRSSFSTGQPG